LGDQIKNEIGGACSTYGNLRCRLKDNIKMDIQEVGWRGLDWFDLDQSRDRWQVLVNVVMNLWVP